MKDSPAARSGPAPAGASDAGVAPLPVTGTPAATGTPPGALGRRFWSALQILVLAALPLWIWLILAFPRFFLPLFWNVVVPLLPLVFLVQPVLWRNVCPLATLNQWTGKRGGGRSLGRGAIGSGVLTLATFALLLPARPLVFDESAIATVVLLLAAAVAALAAGLFVRDRGGFCHLLCPVLPAERLYGVAPAVPTYAARCDACSVCTPRGCPELAGDKAFNQVLGPSRKSSAWVRSPWGVGFLGFPGLVLGFFTVPAAGQASVLATYGWIWGTAALSWGLLSGLTVVSGLGARRAVVIAAGIAAFVYYWAVVPRSVAALGLAAPFTAPLRLAALAIVFLWLARALIRGAGPADGFDHAPWAEGR